MASESLTVISLTENATLSNSSINPIALTPVELWIQLGFFYCFLGGCVSNGLSILISVGILRKKELRTRFFIIVAYLTFCRTGLCTQLFVTGLYRILRTLDLVQLSQPRIVCWFISTWIYNGTVLEQTLLCTLVVDRMLALMAMNFYRLMTDRSAGYICLAQYIIVSLIMFIPSLSLDNMLESAPCINYVNFLNPFFNQYHTYINLFLFITILILYLTLIVHMRIRLSAMKANAAKSEASKVFLQRQLKLMPVFRNLVVLHCAFNLISKALLYSTNWAPAYSQHLVALGSVFAVLDVLTSCGSLLIMNRQIREVAVPCWSDNRVSHS